MTTATTVTCPQLRCNNNFNNNDHDTTTTTTTMQQQRQRPRRPQCNHNHNHNHHDDHHATTTMTLTQLLFVSVLCFPGECLSLSSFLCPSMSVLRSPGDVMTTTSTNDDSDSMTTATA